MRKTWAAGNRAAWLCVVAGAASVALVAPAMRAAAAKPALEIAFGPDDVAADARARFVLTVRNAGAGAAVFGVGDRFDVLHGSGAAPGDLTTDLGTLAAAGTSPAGFAFSTTEGGARVTATAAVTLDPGASLAFEMTGTSGPPGAAPVAVEAVVSKSAGKPPRRSELRVVKAAGASVDPFYGDGSDGDLVLTSDTDLQPLRNYANVRIAANVTVRVPSGATIRCSGTFENRGTIRVLSGNPGGGAILDIPANTGPYSISSELAPATTAVERGDARSAASRPAVMTSQAVSGGLGGRGLGTDVHALPLSSYRTGGGSGSGALGAIGGDGGGLLRIIARGEVRNGGTIVAAGAAGPSNRTNVQPTGGCGGGGGGIVMLLSGVRAANDVDTNANGSAATGTIDVRGGNAGLPDAFGGQGGSGGGGLVVIVAPDVGAVGASLIDPGVVVTGQLQLVGTTFTGGGGGGACVGDGGDGAGVSATGLLNGLPDGSGGFVVPRSASAGLLVARSADPRTLW
ncbi:MAG: hypothetical protein HMLKMBBP_03263 [Planctomycetes bacterium]|nr:hypothetical protein [Planctomycetota bacterium]